MGQPFLDMKNELNHFGTIMGKGGQHEINLFFNRVNYINLLSHELIYTKHVFNL